MRQLHLTNLEQSILRALANGMQSKEIAALLNRSIATIELHVRMLFVKFDARSRAHLVACALCEGAIGSKDLDGFSPGTQGPQALANSLRLASGR